MVLLCVVCSITPHTVCLYNAPTYSVNIENIVAPVTQVGMSSRILQQQTQEGAMEQGGHNLHSMDTILNAYYSNEEMVGDWWTSVACMHMIDICT